MMNLRDGLTAEQAHAIAAAEEILRRAEAGDLRAATMHLETEDLAELLRLAKRGAHIFLVGAPNTYSFRRRAFGEPGPFDALAYDDGTTRTRVSAAVIGIAARPCVRPGALELRTSVPVGMVEDVGGSVLATLIGDMVVRTLAAELQRQRTRDRAVRLDPRRLPR